MSDLLVKLYTLPLPSASPANVAVRRAFAAEKRLVCDWVATQFDSGWASECEASFARLPAACFIAVRDRDLLGFACYDATARGFFGPTGVAEAERRHGIGAALLSAALHDMMAQGYAYAIIGAADSIEFYRKHVGAIEIPDSHPGFYRGKIKRE
jgi:ribosomal protein S18 acetylase RimI-like enzyme